MRIFIIALLLAISYAQTVSDNSGETGKFTPVISCDKSKKCFSSCPQKPTTCAMFKDFTSTGGCMETCCPWQKKVRKMEDKLCGVGSLRQTGESCGSCLCPPTFSAGQCAPGNVCIHPRDDDFSADAPGTCMEGVEIVWRLAPLSDDPISCIDVCLNAGFDSCTETGFDNGLTKNQMQAVMRENGRKCKRFNSDDFGQGPSIRDSQCSLPATTGECGRSNFDVNGIHQRLCPCANDPSSAGEPDCNQCVTDFLANTGACECMRDDNCNVEALIPEGCDHCGQAAWITCAGERDVGENFELKTPEIHAAFETDSAIHFDEYIINALALVGVIFTIVIAFRMCSAERTYSKMQQSYDQIDPEYL